MNSRHIKIIYVYGLLLPSVIAVNLLVSLSMMDSQDVLGYLISCAFQGTCVLISMLEVELVGGKMRAQGAIKWDTAAYSRLSLSILIALIGISLTFSLFLKLCIWMDLFEKEISVGNVVSLFGMFYAAPVFVGVYSIQLVLGSKRVREET